METIRYFDHEHGRFATAVLCWDGKSGLLPDRPTKPDLEMAGKGERIVRRRTTQLGPRGDQPLRQQRQLCPDCLQAEIWVTSERCRSCASAVKAKAQVAAGTFMLNKQGRRARSAA